MESRRDPPSPGKDRASRSKIAPRKQATGPEPCRPIWEDFFWSSPEFKCKIILCLLNIVHSLPPGHFTLASRQAVRLINLVCPP